MCTVFSFVWVFFFQLNITLYQHVSSGNCGVLGALSNTKLGAYSPAALRWQILTKLGSDPVIHLVNLHIYFASPGILHSCFGTSMKPSHSAENGNTHLNSQELARYTIRRTVLKVESNICQQNISNFTGTILIFLCKIFSR